MYSNLVRLTLIVVVVATPFAAQRRKPVQHSPTPLTAAQIAKRILPSIVRVEMTGCERGRVVFGSGFFVDRNLIATNRHVVECGSEGYVTLVEREEKHRVVAKYLDPAHDLALLRVEGLNAPALPLSDTQNLSVGDKVYAAGNPKGFDGTFSDGIISSLRYVAGRIQFTAAISQGSSGGAVVDEYGRVIGVTVSSVTSGQNLNFAVPTYYLLQLSARVKEGKVADALAAAPKSSSTASSPPVAARRTNALGYTLIIDNSSTLQEQLPLLKQVATSIIERNTTDEGAEVLSFRASGERRIQRFTTDRQALLNNISTTDAVRRGWTTPVIDAVYYSLVKAANPTSLFDASSGIVVLTHGMDGVSEHSWDELLGFARTRKVPVFCVLFAPESPDWKSYSDTTRMLAEMKKWQERMKASEQFLRTLTQETGGKLFIPKLEEQLKQFSAEIIQSLRASSGKAATTQMQENTASSR
ncbi:MAG: S1C family serine protease [Pyrinomonadaceae bacterium MAG19_C2-C3]|nr:S1C family serine protease [Pyrinomonadaceae bacterium MAG19_C2-C3]